MKLRNLLIAGLGLAMAAGAAGAVSAQTPAQAHEDAAIHASHNAVRADQELSSDVRHGRISRRQAYRIHHHLVAIRHHARAVARHYSERAGGPRFARLNHERDGVRPHLVG